MPNIPFGSSRPDADLGITSDALANDSDKSFTVPAGEFWEIQSIGVNYVSQTTAGNRRLALSISDGTNVFFLTCMGATQAVTLTYDYCWAPQLANMAAVVNLTLTAGLPVMVLAPGYIIRVWDIAAIAPTLDDMSVYISRKVYK